MSLLILIFKALWIQLRAIALESVSQSVLTILWVGRAQRPHSSLILSISTLWREKHIVIRGNMSLDKHIFVVYCRVVGMTHIWITMYTWLKAWGLQNYGPQIPLMEAYVTIYSGVNQTVHNKVQCNEEAEPKVIYKQEAFGNHDRVKTALITKYASWNLQEFHKLCSVRVMQPCQCCMAM